MNGENIRLPANGSLGVEGQLSNSFVIRWSPVEGIESYEYVLTDNPNCFAGCGGDTRQKKIVDTLAVEFALQSNTWYYWIIKYNFSDSTESTWSPIFSFLATKSKESSPIISAFPTLFSSGDHELTVELNWEANPTFSIYSFQLSAISGEFFFSSPTYIKETTSLRFESRIIKIPNLPPGLYFIEFLLQNDGNTKIERFQQKIVVL